MDKSFESPHSELQENLANFIHKEFTKISLQLMSHVTKNTRK
jgi:hypothetical protein